MTHEPIGVTVQLKRVKGWVLCDFQNEEGGILVCQENMIFLLTFCSARIYYAGLFAVVSRIALIWGVHELLS